MRKVALVVGAVALVATVALLMLRRDRPEPRLASPPSAAPSATACRVTLPDASPGLPPAIPEPLPRSRLALRSDLALADVTRLIEAKVPVQLASAAGRSIGVAGELSYTVARGPLDLKLEDAHLWVRVPVQAQVEVCKPFGPLCPAYGDCTPKLEVGFGVPLMLDAMAGGTQTSLRVAEGCSIVGFDVTGRLTSVASGQIAGVKRRVDAALPTPDQIDALPPLPAGLPLPDGCVVVRPRKLVQAPPKVTAGVLHLAFDAELDLERAASCPDTALAIPPVERGATSASRLVLDAGLVPPAEELQRALALPGATPQPPSYTKGALVLPIDFAGEVCGRAWLAATPTVGDAIRYEPRWLGASPPDGDAFLAAVRAVRQPLPSDATSAMAALNELDASLAKLEAQRPDDVPLQAAVEGAPATLTIAVEPRGLRLRAVRTPTLRVTPR